MTATNGASGSTAPSPTCSRPRSAPSGWPPAPPPIASRWRRCARPMARSSATATRISRIDEAGAPGFFTGGAKLMLLDGPGRQGHAGGGRRGAATAIRNDVHQVQPRGAVDHQRHRIWPGLSRRRGRGAGRAGASSAGSASTWTARGSPMPSPRPARARPTSPGAPGSTLCRSASSRMAGSMPRR